MKRIALGFLIAGMLFGASVSATASVTDPSAILAAKSSNQMAPVTTGGQAQSIENMPSVCGT